MYSMKELKDVLVKDSNKQTIVFPESNEQKIVEVATRLVNEGSANALLIYKNKSEKPADLDERIKVVYIEESDLDTMVNKFVEIRKGKADEATARKLIVQPNYFGAMMIEMGMADAMICGLTFTTADTLRPALQIIKTNPKYSIAASVFMMMKGDEGYVFTDCALNIDPNSQQLADIAAMAAEFAEQMDVKDPQVALLSYSTKGSGAGPDVDKVREAFEILDAKKDKGFVVDGELQFDSAYMKDVRAKKSPNTSITKEHADVYVFPDINAGNIGYKIAQRMGGFTAAGPFILGLNKPVNDLSRGATLEDVYNTALVTAYQSLKK